MKKYKIYKFILILMLIIILLFPLFIHTKIVASTVRKRLFKASTVASGTTGTCNWILDSDGLLLIEPSNGISGTMGNDAPSMFGNPTTGFYIYRNQVKSIRFGSTVYAPTTPYSFLPVPMFGNFSNLESFDSTNFNTQNMTSFSDCFYQCKKLSTINISHFNTENATDMSSMFQFCQALTELDLSNFNTQNVTNMSNMFNYCQVLTELDLSSFNTQNVTNMSSMFDWCYDLINLNLTGFNTENVTTMSKMFNCCPNLKSIDLSNFNTQSVTDMTDAFYNCRKLEQLKLGPNFSFLSNCGLPTYATPWVKEGTTSPRYTSTELISVYDGSTMSGTYERLPLVKISVSIKRDDLVWKNNDIKVALYQNGEEKYAYSQGKISKSQGTITWDVEPGTFDVYASMDSEHIDTLVDTGKDIVAGN